jgi:hypothetical protein
MVICGRAHKARWLFLLWDLHQGTLLLLHRFWQQYGRRFGVLIPSALSWLATFAAITLGWIPFRAKDAEQSPSATRRLGAAVRASQSASADRAHRAGAPFCRRVLHVPGTKVCLGEHEPAEALGWIPLKARFALHGLISRLPIFYHSRAEAFLYSRF